ncbi:MAG: hypothetical protein HZB24_12935 [Desulfobacterales bacterium]|nr:hypothetical protein [Desulfobacterales bacterium]
MLPALAATQDLALLEEIQRYKPMDTQNAHKLKSLIFDFHQTNCWSTIGVLIGLCMTLLGMWLGYEDIVSQSKDLKVTLILMACFAAVIPFSCLVRILGMWSVRRKFQKLP